MTNIINWGILGAGKFAREQMGPAIHMARGARLAAVATSSVEKAAPFSAFAPDLRIHTSYDALLADPDISAVYIPLPNHLHVDWTLRALAAGKPVLCEKPIAMVEADFDRLIAARDASGLLAAEAYMILHHPQWNRARALIADGAIGALMEVRGAFSFNNSDASNIRNRAETGGGALRDIGVYPIGATRFVLGQEPTTLTAQIVRENGVDTITRVQAGFDTVGLTMMVSTRMALHQDMVFHGTQGTLRLPAPFNPVSYGEARIEISRGNAEVTVERFPTALHYVNQVEAFGDTLRTGATYPVSLEFSRGTQAVIDRILAVDPSSP